MKVTPRPTAQYAPMSIGLHWLMLFLFVAVYACIELRVLFAKGTDARGLVFYSHHGSAKGQELAGNPRAALLFHWPALERQLRIEGEVEQVAGEEAGAYFDSRPLPSRLAWPANCVR